MRLTMPKAVAFFEPITEMYISGYSQRDSQRVKYCYRPANALLFTVLAAIVVAPFPTQENKTFSLSDDSGRQQL